MSELLLRGCGAIESGERKEGKKRQACRASPCACVIQNVIIIMDQAMIPGVH
jgi:hypothetical protein